MRKNKLLLLLALLMTAATGAWAQEVIPVTLDFTSNTWGIPEGTEGKTAVENSYTSGGYTITLCGSSGNGYYFSPTEPYILLGKQGAYLQLPAFSSAVDSIKVVGSPNASTSVVQNIYVDDNNSWVAVSTATTGMKNVTQKYVIAENYRAAGNIYYIKVDNGYNTQIKKVLVYFTPEAAAGYTVSMKSGVKDADKWTVKVGEGQAQALPISGLKGDGSETITLKYTGRLKVKGVKATSDAAPAAGNSVDLATLTENKELKDGDVLTGTLASNVKISIADGATVTLDGVTINGVNDMNYEWAGITCLGDATIILSGTNTVNGFYQDYPGIQAAAGKTLIINGTGSLTASSYGKGAGIGGVNNVACGNIEIQDGTITATSLKYGAGIGGGDRADCGNITISGGTVYATGGERGAGIGGGRRGPDNGSCGNILISGGTVTATGGENAAGIGGGRGYNNTTFSSCGTITITAGVTKVTATMGDGAPYSIGAGRYGTCGTVTIGGVEGAITTSPYTYDPAAQSAKTPATVTTAPTGAEIVGRLNTNSTELVSGGVADGGTLMYAVTTTNTKPTSTAGFSDAVPTAKDITASGKVYVWYYVKGDDTHTDSEIAATAIEVPVADIVWDATNVSNLEVFEGDPYEKEGVTMSSYSGNVFATWTDNGDPTTDGIAFQAYETGGYTFTAPTGKKFTKIEMTLTGPAGWDEVYEAEKLGSGWAFWDMSYPPFVTWKGTAAASTVGLLTDDGFEGDNVKSIVFYLSE